MNQQLIEQYVAGKLSEAEAEAFEDSFVANRDLARLVELEQRLKDGLALVASGSTEEFVRATFPDLYPQAVLQVLPNAGHYPMMETPAYLVTAIEAFLTQQ